MSGGSLNYFYCQLEDHVGDFGDKELDELVKDLAELFHDREWYLSADYGEGDWIEARDEFKAKWFTPHGRQERIERYLSNLANEVRESFGIVKGRCKSCKHWTKESEHYGKCDYINGCLQHRSETCEKYEDGEETEMKFIILTRICDGKALYVNPKQICFIDRYAENGALIQFCGDDENYIQVLESPETIAELCKGMTE